jgi:two-component system, chemotaxis family, chemotaxis protein CheY
MQASRLTYVVDDDSIVQLICRTVLAKFPVFSPVEVFADGNFALEALQNLPLPSYIFLDINMPNLNGWQLLEAMKQEPAWRGVEVFIITSSIDPADEEKALQYPQVKAFLPKPITQERITKLLTTLS